MSEESERLAMLDAERKRNEELKLQATRRNARKQIEAVRRLHSGGMSRKALIRTYGQTVVDEALVG